MYMDFFDLQTVKLYLRNVELNKKKLKYSFIRTNSIFLIILFANIIEMVI